MKKTNVTLFAALLCYSTLSAAATIDLQWDGWPFNPSSPAGPFDMTLFGTHMSESPDRYHGTITAASGIDPTTIGDRTGIPEGLFTYCYELTQVFYGGSTYTYTVLPGAVNNGTLDFLGAVNAINAGHGALGWLNPQDANMAAAIQLGIWETLYDVGTFDLSGGNFTVVSDLGSTPGSVGAYLNQFKGAMGSTTDLSAQFIAQLDSDSAQNQIIGLTPTARLVPEPGTLALLALGAMVGCATRRKAVRK